MGNTVPAPVETVTAECLEEVSGLVEIGVGLDEIDGGFGDAFAGDAALDVERAVGAEELVAGGESKGSETPLSAERETIPAVPPQSTAWHAKSVNDAVKEAKADDPIALARKAGNRVPQPQEFRFNVGDHVIANVGEWRVGMISRLNWREDDWSPSHPSSPYQIALKPECRFVSPVLTLWW